MSYNDLPKHKTCVWIIVHLAVIFCNVSSGSGFVCRNGPWKRALPPASLGLTMSPDTPLQKDGGNTCLDNPEQEMPDQTGWPGRMTADGLSCPLLGEVRLGRYILFLIKVMPCVHVLSFGEVRWVPPVSQHSEGGLATMASLQLMTNPLPFDLVWFHQPPGTLFGGLNGQYTLYIGRYWL